MKVRSGRSRLPGLLSVCLLAGCADPRLERIRVDADEYIHGIQFQDPTGVLKRLAPFRAEIASRPSAEWPAIRERYIDQVRRRFAEYEAAKATGHLALAEDGITLIQGLALGKGIYYAFREAALEEGRERARGTMEVLPDYAPRRFEALPPGTRVYLLGEPLGMLHTVILGKEPQERTVRVISQASLEWRFTWFDEVDVYPAGWAVESVHALPADTGFTDLTRVF